MSPWWLPFEGDGGRLYFGSNLSRKRRINSEETENLTHFHVEIFSKFFSVELASGLWNDGVCREFELARR